MSLDEIRPATPEEVESSDWSKSRRGKKTNSDAEKVNKIIQNGNVARIMFSGQYSPGEALDFSKKIKPWFRRKGIEIEVAVETQLEQVGHPHSTSLMVKKI